MARSNGSVRVCPGTEGISIEVLVVTNCSRDVNGDYTTRPHEDGKTRYETLKVFIPNDVGRGGELDKSSWNADPSRSKDSFPNKESFIARLEGVMTRTRSDKILIFIPGFRSTMKSYARIAAKMARDMDFVGPILLFSWRACQFLEYFQAEKWLESSIPQLVQILRDVKDYLPNAEVVMLGYSLGGRLLIKALIKYITGSEADDIVKGDVREVRRKLEPKLGDIRESLTKIPRIVLAAPDVSMEDFRAFCRLLREIPGVPQVTYPAFALPIVTVYCARDDVVLACSEAVHLLQSRLGSTRACQLSIEEKKLNLNDGEYDFVDIVDATGVYKSKANHSYYYRSSHVLNDMKKVFNGERARDRAAAFNGASIDPDFVHIQLGYQYANGTIYTFIPVSLQASGGTVLRNSLFRWDYKR
ncbi:hypothetical protein M758_3G108600 [Ceratodon purpureus]|nr:hypothetical protein M758_3G108600 [Ceratodon purpureus]